MERSPSPLTVSILIYPNAEVLDFSGPFEVFSTANRFFQEPIFRVSLVSADPAPVTARGQYIVVPHSSISHVHSSDVLVVSGGVHSEAQHDVALLQWIQQQAAQATIVSSVCTGAFLLAEAGLLNGKTVTTHWEDIEDLQAQYPKLLVISGRRWVEQGNLITSAGISAGIDMSLHIVRRLAGEEIAQKTARQMEFDWQQA